MRTEPWTPEEIKERLKNSEVWLYHGIKAIYNKQTEDEKVTEQTKHLNNVGFNGVDAEFLSSMARNLDKYKSLTPKQLAVSRKMMLKYSKQLTLIANGKL